MNIKKYMTFLVMVMCIFMLIGCDLDSIDDQTNGGDGPFTITWKNYDGTVLEVDENVEKGMMPSYDGATPKRPSSGETSYSKYNKKVDCIKLFNLSTFTISLDYVLDLFSHVF
jgi:hypothetical protein